MHGDSSLRSVTGNRSLAREGPILLFLAPAWWSQRGTSICPALVHLLFTKGGSKTFHSHLVYHTEAGRKRASDDILR